MWEQRSRAVSTHKRTWPVHEITLAEAGDLGPFQEQDRGRKVGLQDLWTVLQRKLTVFWVQAETFPYDTNSVIPTFSTH